MYLRLLRPELVEKDGAEDLRVRCDADHPAPVPGETQEAA